MFVGQFELRRVRRRRLAARPSFQSTSRVSHDTPSWLRARRGSNLPRLPVGPSCNRASERALRASASCSFASDGASRRLSSRSARTWGRAEAFDVSARRDRARCFVAAVCRGDHGAPTGQTKRLQCAAFIKKFTKETPQEEAKLRHFNKTRLPLALRNRKRLQTKAGSASKLRPLLFRADGGSGETFSQAALAVKRPP